MPRTSSHALPFCGVLLAAVLPAQQPAQHVATTATAIEPDSPRSFELGADPRGGTARGDTSGTAPIPAFLKQNPYRLAFTGGDYRPAPFERLDPVLVERWRTRQAGQTRTYGFVMFKGRITAAKLDRVRRLGVDLDTFHTFQSYTATIPFAALPALRASDDVYWVGYARPVQKIDPELAAAVATSPPSARRFLFVNVFASDLGPRSIIRPLGASVPAGLQLGHSVTATPHVTIPNGPFQRALEADGARVISYHDDLRVFVVEAPLGSVTKIAAHDFVHFCELNLPATPDHDRSMRIIGVDAVRGTAPRNGKDAVLGMLDTGYYYAHADLPDWAVGWSFDSGSAGSIWQDADGHGTHVAGTILGRGLADTKQRGCAPGVAHSGSTRLYIGKIIAAKSFPNNALAAFDTFRHAYVFGGLTTPKPHAVNNSWGYGTAVAAGYPGTDNVSRGVDNAVYANDQTYVFGTGNLGGASFVTEAPRSIRRPGVAKNALTVASCTSGEGGDPGGNWDTGRIYYSSGKGPTSDGRLKPNLNAPGVAITSTKTGTTSAYETRSGSSMAVPHVTGVLAGLTSSVASQRNQPALNKAWLTSQAMPRRGQGSWLTAAENWFYRQGLGQVDAYKTHFEADAANGWRSGWSQGVLTSANSGASFDVTVPNDATRVRWVLCFDEKAASSGAKRAALADLDLYIDVGADQQGFNTGEFSSKRAWDTWEWYHHIASAPLLRGKKVRIKVFPRVRPAPSTTVKWAVGYIIQRGSPTPSGSVALSGPSMVRAKTDFTLTSIASLPASVLSNATLSVSSGSDKLTARGLSVRSQDGLAWTYPVLGLRSWPLGNLRFNQGAASRRVDWVLRHETSKVIAVCVTLFGDNQQPIARSFCHTLCVDGTPPEDVSGLASTTLKPGVWGRSRQLAVKWNPVKDKGCAGFSGLASKLSLGAPEAPSRQNIQGNPGVLTMTLGASAKGQYFNLRAVDKVGNLSAKTASIGPFLVDLEAPVIDKVAIESGATYTPTPVVAVDVDARDAESGVVDVRFSGDSTLWTGWLPFAKTTKNLNLASYGWSAAEGVKSVYVEVRDKVGRISKVATDTIIYLRAPAIVQADPARLDNVTDGAFVLQGFDFLGVESVRFGPRTLRSQNADDWFAGHFSVVSDRLIKLFPPQAAAPGSYEIELRNRLWKSNVVKRSIVYAAQRVLFCSPQRALGKPIHVVAARGDMPSTTFDLLTLSASSRPLLLPGLVALGHGGNPITIVDPSFFMLTTLTPHDPTARAAGWVLPSVVRGTFWFQSIKIDAAKANILPFRTSSVDSVRVY